MFVFFVCECLERRYFGFGLQYVVMAISKRLVEACFSSALALFLADCIYVWNHASGVVLDVILLFRNHVLYGTIEKQVK